MPEMITFVVTQTREVRVTPRYVAGESPESMALEEAESLFDDTSKQIAASHKVRVTNTHIERVS